MEHNTGVGEPSQLLYVVVVWVCLAVLGTMYFTISAGNVNVGVLAAVVATCVRPCLLRKPKHQFDCC